jgi:hypothetical protein
LITFSHRCSDFQRDCNICNKTIKSKSPSGLNNNFHQHLKIHDMSAKEYKAWVLKNQLGRAQPSGGSGAGFGGDFGGGDFGGGFDDQDDRGAQDDRFEDVPDEPTRDGKAKVTLAVALKDKTMRALFVSCDDFWRDAALRQRLQLARFTKTGAMTATAKHLSKLAKSG